MNSFCYYYVDTGRKSLNLIIVNTAIMQEEIIELLEGLETPDYNFVKKSGIRLYFTCDAEDLDHAAIEAKKEIKKIPNASSIFFSVVVDQ